MSKLILYGTLASPAVRGVLLTLHALDLEYELKVVDLQAGDTRTEEFLKKNPQHTIPVLEDGDDCFWDSHAIMAYLVRKYGKTDALYPKDFYQRAIVDQRLHFESGTLSAGALRKFMSPHLTKEEKIAAVFESYGFLEAFLTGTYLAGEQLTIADFSVLSSLTTADAVVPVDPAKFPKLSAWLELMKQLPYYEEANGKGMEAVIARVKEMVAAGQV